MTLSVGLAALSRIRRISGIRMPRLLPVTIAVLALALGARTLSLGHSALVTIRSATLIPAAWAAETPGAHGAAKPVPKPTEPAKAEHGQPAKAEAKPAAAEPARAEDKPPAKDAPPSITDAERAVLLELRQRRQDLEARDATLAARESLLAAAEQKLAARIGELQSLQQRLETLDSSRKQQEDVAWQGLVKVYETMKPRDAAAIFNDLGMQILLSVVDRMKEAKAAAILAAMLPDKAREVTTQLAQARTRTTEALRGDGKPALAPEPRKAPGSGT